MKEVEAENAGAGERPDQMAESGRQGKQAGRRQLIAQATCFGALHTIHINRD